MTRTSRWLQIAALVSIVGGMSIAEAGWIMVEREGDTSLISNGRLKSSAEGVSWILDGPAGKMIFIDENRKSYASGTVEDYCQATASLLDETMDGLSAEQRKVLKDMMRQNQNNVGYKVTVSVAGSGDTVAGLETTKYRVQVDGEPYKDIWLATEPGLMLEFKPLIPLLKKFSACANTFGTEFMPENSAEYLRMMDWGVEIKSVIYADNGPEPATEMIEMEYKTLPETNFSIPADYRQMTFEEMLKSQMASP